MVGLPVFDFEPPPFTAPVPLQRARVAIVTTAGFRADGQARWALGDQSFTVLDSAPRHYTLAHFSTNFDRSGITADINTAFPIDRLRELAAAGEIGSVAPRHLSFMGAQPDHVLETLRLDTGPQAAAVLRADGVDVVLLTPV